MKKKETCNPLPLATRSHGHRSNLCVTAAVTWQGNTNALRLVCYHVCHHLDCFYTLVKCVHFDIYIGVKVIYTVAFRSKRISVITFCNSCPCSDLTQCRATLESLTRDDSDWRVVKQNKFAKFIPGRFLTKLDTAGTKVEDSRSWG